jgi:hypothetical protein
MDTHTQWVQCFFSDKLTQASRGGIHTYAFMRGLLHALPTGTQSPGELVRSLALNYCRAAAEITD